VSGKRRREALSPRHKRAHSFGLRAEAAALALLMLSGYRILARRYLAPGGEIDIIASKADSIVFVEVKARPSLDQARVAVTEDKRRRISRAARHWLAHQRTLAGFNLRGDAIFVAPWRWPRHLRGAFELAID
jgi:putative endonuclease